MTGDLFEWDEAKYRSNLEIHGVAFEYVSKLDWDTALTIEQLRDGEQRCLTYALLGSRLHAVVWTERNHKLRIISFRKANSRECDRYEKYQATGN